MKSKAYRRRAILEGLAGMACLVACLILPSIVDMIII